MNSVGKENIYIKETYYTFICRESDHKNWIFAAHRNGVTVCPWVMGGHKDFKTKRDQRIYDENHYFNRICGVDGVRDLKDAVYILKRLRKRDKENEHAMYSEPYAPDKVFHVEFKIIKREYIKIVKYSEVSVEDMIDSL